MGIGKVYRPLLEKIWRYLIGTSEMFAPEEQSFNGVCILSLGLLIILLPFNAIIGLWKVCIMMGVLTVLVWFFYYQARFRHRHTMGIISYAVASYITLILNYFFNAGSLGPTLFLFLLTFQLLIAFSNRQLHMIWFLGHLLVTATLLIVELWHPKFVPYTYGGKQERFTDLISSYLVILVCMYGVTIYLRNKYSSERKVAEERASRISQQNQQLEHINMQKNKLFSIMAHDLRGPFNSISQVVDMLNSNHITEEEHALFMGHLKDFTVSTSDMLSNMLSWSYGQLQGTKVHLATIPVTKVAESVLYAQQLFAVKKQITLSAAVPAGHEVLADYNMLEIVLRNLVNNAIKFTAAGGRIQLFSQVRNNHCYISVQDTGIGLSKEAEEHLFTFNLTSTRGTQNEKGIGLGLHLCREFVELQNGTIDVETEPGNGSVFTICLPVGK